MQVLTGQDEPGAAVQLVYLTRGQLPRRVRVLMDLRRGHERSSGAGGTFSVSTRLRDTITSWAL